MNMEQDARPDPQGQTGPRGRPATAHPATAASPSEDELFSAHVADQCRLYHEAMTITGHRRAVIAAGGREHRFLDDIPLPFHPNPHLSRWLPLDQHPGALVVLHHDQGRRPMLLLSSASDHWHDPPPAPETWAAACFEVRDYRDERQLKSLLPDLERRTAFIGPPHARPGHLGWAESNPQSLLHHLDYHRAWKSPYELACMRAANRLAAQGHRAAERAFREGASEYGIHMAYLQAIGMREEELPYGNIIALNEHGAVLHHMTTARRPPPVSRSLLIDAGARCRGYAADISRTHVAEGAEHREFGQLVAAMDRLQQELVAQVRPGLPYPELHLEAHHRIAALLREAGLIRPEPEEAVATGLSGVFFPHGLGHLLGIQVHDRGGWLSSPAGTTRLPPVNHGSLRCTRTLEAGMVVTVEPGLYFIPQLLDAWREEHGRNAAGSAGSANAGAASSAICWPQVERWLPYGGIRIEDDIALHADSTENLSRDGFAATTAG